MFGNMKNLASLMSQAGELKERFANLQEELAKKQVDGEAGAGAVRVRMNCKFEVIEVKLDPAMIATLAGGSTAEPDRELVEQLIAGAFNDAVAQAQSVAKDEISKASGGLNLPGLDGLLGG